MTTSLHYPSPVGGLLIDADDTGITRIRFVQPDETAFSDLAGQDETDTASVARQAILDQGVRWLATYFAGHDPGALPPIHAMGTPFQRQVWDLLRTIPYGATTTYGDMARSIAVLRHMPRMSAQAIGQAVGANPVPIMVPCHRVLGSGRRLTGYAYGTDRKAALLTLEGASFLA